MGAQGGGAEREHRRRRPEENRQPEYGRERGRGDQQGHMYELSSVLKGLERERSVFDTRRRTYTYTHASTNIHSRTVYF